jgi:hypothetical protein
VGEREHTVPELFRAPVTLVLVAAGSQLLSALLLLGNDELPSCIAAAETDSAIGQLRSFTSSWSCNGPGKRVEDKKKRPGCDREGTRPAGASESRFLAVCHGACLLPAAQRSFPVG